MIKLLMSSVRAFPLFPVTTPKASEAPNWLAEAAMTLAHWVQAERLGRRKYILVNVISGITGFGVIFVPYLFFLLLPDIDLTILAIPLTILGVVAVIAMLIVFLGTSISRLRDMGVSRYWAIAGLIPYVNILFFMTLALTEGSAIRLNRKDYYGRKRAEAWKKRMALEKEGK